MDFQQHRIHNVQQTIKMINNAKKQDKGTSEHQQQKKQLIGNDFEMTHTLKLAKTKKAF